MRSLASAGRRWCFTPATSPYVVGATGHVELGSRALPDAVITQLLDQLLPEEARSQLSKSGKVCYIYPPGAYDGNFSVVAALCDDGLWAEIRRQVPSTAGPVNPERRNPPLVLLIDDSLDQLDLYETVLRDRYEVLQASRGEAGVKLAIANQPDLIVVDLNMPGIDGWEVCRRLKADPRTASIPVVILTALEGETLQSEARRVGAVQLLSKPCSVDTLCKALAPWPDTPFPGSCTMTALPP